MSDGAERELFRVHRESQNRYVFFLLAAAATATGFALTQTQDLPIRQSQIPLLFAVSCWGLSFFCGCKQLQQVIGYLYDNGELLKVEAGKHQLSGSNQQYMKVGSEFFREKLEKISGAAAFYFKWQFRLLILGFMSYVFWHVLEMWLRTFQ